jgi:hypothetical protein
MRVPGWFLRELSFIDPRYYVVIEGDGFTTPFSYQIRFNKKVFTEGPDGKWVWHWDSPILAEFDHLNDEALNRLRYRKWLGRHFEVPDKTEAWKDRAYRKPRKEKLARVKESVIDDQTEMIHEAYMYDKRKYYS